MEIKGFQLLLQDFCEYCPDFIPEVETIDCRMISDTASKSINSIRCQHRKRCARIAQNIANKVNSNG